MAHRRSKSRGRRTAGLFAALCAGLVASLSCIMAAGGAAEARSKPLTYEFDVVWSLFPELTLAKGRFVMMEEGGGYKMGLEARARLTAPPVDWRGALATEGAKARGGRAPLRFERSSVRPNLQEAIVVSWEDDSVQPETIVLRTPHGVDIAREEVDPSQVRNVVDPLTFLATVMDRVVETNGASCDVTATTWDGQRLADVQISTGDRLEAARLDCAIRYRSIAGLRKDTPWRLDESSTSRIVRFEKVAGQWRPRWIRIEANVIGIRSTFTTTIRSVD